MSNFQQRLYEGLAILNYKLKPETVERLELYFTELKKWSRKVNLIAKSSTDEQIIENHFLDSLTLIAKLQGSDKHLLDIGSGAGFPGLVCKVACPEVEVTLLEPRLKRVSFLKHIVRSLELEGVTVIDKRVEEYQWIFSKTIFSHITARAVADIKGLFVMVQQIGSEEAEILFMKGPKWSEELVEAEAIIKQSGYSLVHREKCLLPFSRAERNLLVFQPENKGKVHGN